MTTISNLLPAYMDYLQHERGLAKATRWAYKSDLKALERALGKDIEDITRSDLRAFMRLLSHAGKKTSTIRRTMHGFGTFWKWLYVEGRVTEVVTEYIDLPRRNQTFPTWMSEQELRRFVAATDSEDVPARDAAAWRLLAHTGMRPDELRQLQVCDVDLQHGLITVRNTKSRRDRVLPLPACAAFLLAGMLATKAPADYVLGCTPGRPWKRQTMIQAFNAHLRRSGLDGHGYTMYTLRHSFATHLAMSGAPAHVIKELLGHRSLATTEVYLHAAPASLHEVMRGFVLNRSE